MKLQFPLAAAALILVLSGVLRAADPPPTPDELKQLFTDKNFKELLPKLNKALAVKGADAAQYDKYALLTMKGEASLQTHAKPAATDAFKQAAAAATKPEDAAMATGTAELIKESAGNLKYLPRTKSSKDDKPEAIDIVDPDSRKKALEALETDLAAKLKPKIDAIVKGNSLPDVVAAAKSPDLATLKAVEIAATGSDSDSRQMIGDLGEHASSMMDTALDKMNTDMDTDTDQVNHRDHPAAAKPGAPVITSVSQFEQAITGINSNAKQIQDYASSMKGLFGDGTDLKPILLKATEIQGRARTLLASAKKAGG